ncbi:hypothetical protein D915_004960 [Fasciola hepatica]|uniref:Uncharacterized protein n=1 Tax=Fasciola hepatica TaxID=6192 RepID=A0A4E0S111_FASHE|nr:hypothetical protein D915_004960 [Fasciola hepatica]
MPRLRNRSVSSSTVHNTQSLAKENIVVSDHVDSSAERRTRPIRPIPKQSDTIEPRLTRSSGRSGRLVSSRKESSETDKHAASRKPILTNEDGKSGTTVPVELKRIVTRRTRRTELPKTQDPYAFDFFACSDDEKENIDPRSKPRGKLRSALKVPKPVQADVQKPQQIRPPSPKPTVSTFASPIVPLSGRPSVHFSAAKRSNVPASPRRPSMEPSLAEIERRKNASATILLALPSSQRTTHNSPVFSVSSLTPTHLLSASTPANQMHSTNANVKRVTASGPSVLLLPLETTSLDPHAAASQTQPPPDHGELLAEKSTQSSIASSSNSLGEEKKERSSGILGRFTVEVCQLNCSMKCSIQRFRRRPGE